MSLCVIDRCFTQMIAYFLVMNSKRYNYQSRDSFFFWLLFSGEIEGWGSDFDSEDEDDHEVVN